MRRLWEESLGSIDLRLAVYGGLKHFAVIFAVGLLIKIFVFDSLKIDGSQMEPAIRSGDRVLLFKAPYLMPFIKSIGTGRGKPVVVTLADKGVNTVLRIAAVSGDTVKIDGGQFYRNGIAVEKFFKDTEKYGVIPADYSPGDFMGSMRVPAPADSISFSELAMRDFIFAFSVFSQETSNARLKAHIITGDTAAGDFQIKNFSLYRGSLDSIPEEMHTDWFFWNKLQSYLNITAEGTVKPRLAFTVWKGNKEIQGFKVKDKYVFLIGDNWNGARDSRHFGPVMRSNVKGRPLLTFWGSDVDDDGKKKLNWGRIGRFVK